MYLLYASKEVLILRINFAIVKLCHCQMSVVKGVGGVCDMCMCLARGGWRGGCVDERIGFGLYQTCGTGGVLGMCLCFGCGGVGGVCGEWVWGWDQGRERWAGVMYVCMRCESRFSVYKAGPGICVLCLADTCTSEVHRVFNHVSPYAYLLSDMYFIWQISQIQTCLFKVV